jgi:hypothetical protein
MIEEIRRERTVELMLENRRYDDIIRWKIAETVLPKAVVTIKFIQADTNEAIDGTARARLSDAEGKLNGVFVYPSPNMYVHEEAQFRSFNPGRDYYYPIPTNEISKSENNIKQNPMWDL